jgi:hypothetical protein
MKPDKINLSLGLLLILTIISWITSCTHDAKISDLPVICFDRDVLPIFQNNCAIPRCHDGGGRGSEMALDTYASISRNVVAGKPNSSRLYKTIVATGGEGKMPPGQPLSMENRTIIRIWIEQGASQTTCPGTASSVKGIENVVNKSDLNNY